MSFFRNMKLGTKLYLSFSLFTIAAIAIILISAGTLRSIIDDTFLMMEKPVERYNILNIMHGDLVDSRRIVANMAFHIADESTLQNLRNEASRGQAELMAGLNAYDANMQADDMIDPQRRNELLAESAVLRTLINRYSSEIVEGMFQAASNGVVGDPGSRAKVESYLIAGSALYDEIAELFESLRTGAIVTRDNRTNELLERSAAARIQTLVICLVVLVFIILIAFFLVHTITTPLKQVVAALGGVAKGQLNLNLRRGNISKDETGELTLYTITLIDVIRDIVYDLSNVQEEYCIKGNMKHRVDTSKYENEFQSMVISINGIMDSEVENLQNINDTLGHIGNGDFKVEVDELPGDFIMQTHAIRGIIAKLDSVNEEIINIVNAVANKGDLSYKIDTSQFNGSWKDIMEGLTDICKAVDTPLKVLDLAVAEMSNGNFDLESIDGKLISSGLNADPKAYPGVFRDILQGFEDSIIAISSYIGEIDKVLAHMAQGDLRSSITREFVGSFDQIKKSVNNISSTLNKTISEISSASGNVLAGAKQISISAGDLANGAQTQASSIEELNASIDVISHQTSQNAESSANANNLSVKSTANAKDGNESMKQMLSAMEQIKEASSDISKIIKSIQDIAFQTNLLALNAAVEAARAGEHGKGFAVVAEEVRNLAARSQSAANETTELIQDSIGRVESGSGIAVSTSKSLDVIVTGATEISDIINSITTASRDQAEAISQVSIGLNQISQVVQTNSATSEETAAAAEELNSQSEILQQLVGYFRL